MKVLESWQEYLEAFGAVKDTASNFSTSFYVNSEQVQTWIRRRSLYVVNAPGCLLVLRKDGNFHHLAHVAADRPSLCRALAAFAGVWTGPLVTDLIGSPEEIPCLAEPYRQCGFTPHRSLVRMSRIGGGDPASSSREPGVTLVPAVAAPKVASFLVPLLDPWTEQVPDLADLEAWCRGGRVLAVEHGNNLSGILAFEVHGLSAVLRYWFVNPENKNQGVGSKLIRTFLDHCKDCRRVTLWVISDNSDSIAKYQHYGFSQDRLMDQVLVTNRE